MDVDEDLDQNLDFFLFDSLRSINNLSVIKGRAMCLAQGHNAVTPVRLEPAAPQSRVKNSTTEPPLKSRSLARLDKHS